MVKGRTTPGFCPRPRSLPRRLGWREPAQAGDCEGLSFRLQIFSGHEALALFHRRSRSRTFFAVGNRARRYWPPASAAPASIRTRGSAAAIGLPMAATSFFRSNATAAAISGRCGKDRTSSTVLIRHLSPLPPAHLIIIRRSCRVPARNSSSSESSLALSLCVTTRRPKISCPFCLASRRER